MIATPPLAWMLSAAFVLTGGYALLRWSATMTGPLPREQRTAELAHLLMGVSMLVMTWTWFGTAGLTVQIALFTLFTAYFAVRAVRRWRGSPHGCAGGWAHALMAAAMVWMLASMPLVMAAPASASASGGGHTGHSASDMATPSAGPAGWAVGVTLAVCVALLVSCGYWAMRALRRDPTPEPAAATEAGPGPVATLEHTEASPVATGAFTPFGPRSDAGCHAVMSLGMVVMLVGMVAGW